MVWGIAPTSSQILKQNFGKFTVRGVTYLIYGGSVHGHHT